MSRVNITPRTAADMDCTHPHCAGRYDVVIESVADIEDLLSWHLCFINYSYEEFAIRFGYTPCSRRTDEVHIQSSCAQHTLDTLRLITRNSHRESAPSCCRDTFECIRIEVTPLNGYPRLRPSHTEHLPHSTVVVAALDECTENTAQRKRRHAHLFRDVGPQPTLVDKCLSDIEHDTPDPLRKATHVIEAAMDGVV